jgi:hypothetical protein
LGVTLAAVPGCSSAEKAARGLLLSETPSGLFRPGIDQPIQSHVSRTRVGEREADLLSVIVDFDTETTAMDLSFSSSGNRSK